VILEPKALDFFKESNDANNCIDKNNSNTQIQRLKKNETLWIETSQFGGPNNIGKTVLLEALLLNCAPTAQNVSLLKRLRGFDTEYDKEFPEYTWDNFFYNQQKPITIVCAYDNDREITLSIHCDESKADFESSHEQNNVTDLISVSNFETSLKSTLHFNYLIDGKNYPVLALISHAKGITGNTFKVHEITKVSYMPPSYQRTNASLAKEYGKAEKRNQADLVLKALQIMDSSIEDIKTAVVGGIHLEVKRKNGHFMPLSLFGDAMKKVTNIVLNLINNNNTIANWIFVSFIARSGFPETLI